MKYCSKCNKIICRQNKSNLCKSCVRKGIKPKNFNEFLKKAHTSETWKKIGKSNSIVLIGNIPWNKGLTIRNEKYHQKWKKIGDKMIRISHLVWCQANQIHRIPDGCVIHHIDCNSKNNSPENLQLLEEGYHHSLHNQICKELKQKY